MKKILAIGGAVIKTAQDDLIERIQADEVKMLIHNGGSIFHDFQIARGEVNTAESTSIPLTDLMDGYEVNKPTSDHIWRWMDEAEDAPEGSATAECERRKIPVIMFTILGADFWHMFAEREDWAEYGRITYRYFQMLCYEMKFPFHFINQGSAVVHPELFLKAVATVKPKQFRADVVDFLDMYRPRTRVSQYGRYYEMTHKEFFLKWKNGEIDEFTPTERTND